MNTVKCSVFRSSLDGVDLTISTGGVLRLEYRSVRGWRRADGFIVLLFCSDPEVVYEVACRNEWGAGHVVGWMRLFNVPEREQPV